MRTLYIDIETAPSLVWTWNLFPRYIPPDNVVEEGYMLCFAAMWEGEREVIFHSIKNESKMYEVLWNLLDEADAVVHYNGTKFDVPHMNREFMLRKYPPPSHFHQIDLLKTVRKQFKFLSNKLGYVGPLLEVGGKTPHTGFQMWLDCMEGKDAAWKTMERYNKRDIKLLRQVYKRLLPWIHNHPNMGMYMDDPAKPTCTNCGSTNVIKKGTQYNTKTASYDRYTCKTCGTPLRSRLRSKPTSENVLARTP